MYTKQYFIFNKLSVLDVIKVDNTYINNGVYKCLLLKHSKMTAHRKIYCWWMQEDHILSMLVKFASIYCVGIVKIQHRWITYIISYVILHRVCMQTSFSFLLDSVWDLNSVENGIWDRSSLDIPYLEILIL